MIIYFEGGIYYRSGRDPRGVARETDKFIQRVLADDPDTRVALVSHQVNRYTPEVVRYLTDVDSLHYQLSLQFPQVDYIDATRCLLGKDNRPYQGIYLPDNRHPNQLGYFHFAKPIRAYLEKTWNSDE